MIHNIFIPIDIYILRNDAFNYIVSIPSISNTGKEYFLQESFHPTIVMALDNVLNRILKNSSINSFDELTDKISEVKQLMDSVLSDIEASIGAA